MDNVPVLERLPAGTTNEQWRKCRAHAMGVGVGDGRDAGDEGVGVGDGG